MCPALLILNLHRSPSSADPNFLHALSSMPPLMLSPSPEYGLLWTGDQCKFMDRSQSTLVSSLQFQPYHLSLSRLQPRLSPHWGSCPTWLRKGPAVPHSRCSLTPAIVLLITSLLLPRASHVALSKLPVISRLTLQLLAVWGKDCHFTSCTAQRRAQSVPVGCLWVLCNNEAGSRF